MKQLLFTLSLLLFINIGQAQDFLYKKDGTTISCKIREVKVDIIRFKRTDIKHSPVFEVKKEDIYKIQYKSGVIDILDPVYKVKMDTIGGKISSGEIEMVYVEGGTFIMGCTSEQSDCDNDEKPQHQVTLNSFYIGKYEMTQEQWKEVMGHNPSWFKNCESCPVESVTWNEIQKFIQKLNAKTGKNYRLPSEAEWEYAARGGKHSQGYKYSGSSRIDIIAWYDENSSSKTHSVGQKSPNELGIFDMTGNVWELCSDIYGPYSSDPLINPQGSMKGSKHVYRGGSWYNLESQCHISNRSDGNTFYYLNSDHGFRLALSK